MKIAKITPEYFTLVKRSIRWNWSMKKVAAKHGISLSTALNIKGCKTYAEYMELVKSEHQPTVYSMRDAAIDLHKLVFDKNNNKYVPPKTGQQAMNELLYRIKNEDLIK